MSNQKLAGILLAGTLVVVLIVSLVKRLANSMAQFLAGIGIPASLASDFGSIIFFGGLLLLVVLGIRAIPRLSRV
jgi:hypothetical protein